MVGGRVGLAPSYWTFACALLLSIMSLAGNCLAAQGAQTKSAPDELDQARLEYEKAFETYTGLVTSGGEGNVKEALEAYRRAYKRYQDLLHSRHEQAEATPTPARTPRPSPTDLTPPHSPDGTLGGFRADELPPAIEERAARIGPEGGSVALEEGARLTVPRRGLSRPAVLALRRLPDAGEDMRVYHIASEVERLDHPAALEMPIPLRDGKTPLAVDVLHFHDASSRGELLRTDWAPGRPTVRAELKELSLVYVVFLWGARVVLTSVALNELEIQALSNTWENFDAQVQAAMKAARHKSVRLRVPAYNQHFPETLWCWASSFAGTLQAVRPLDKHLADPLKPQAFAAWGRYGRTGFGAGPSGAQWRSEENGILKYVNEKSGHPVEGHYFARYPPFAVYLIETLDAGSPVSLDVRSKTHTVTIVGYEPRGVWVQDPASMTAPELTSWRAIYTVVDQGSTSFSNNFVLTTVIKRDISSNTNPTSMNVPSCEWNAASGNVVNRNGVFLTVPGVGAHAGFQWDGTAPLGMRLVAGRPGGPEAEPVSTFVIGAETRIGCRNIEVGNVGDAPVRAAFRLELVEQTPFRTTTLIQGDIDVPEGGISTHDFPEVPILPLLPATLFDGEDVRVRASLRVAGTEVDRLDMPMRVTPFRLDEAKVRCRKRDGTSIVNLRGSGFRTTRTRLKVVTAAAGVVDLADLVVSSNEEAEAEVGRRPEALAGEMFITIEPAGDDPLTRWAGLESNRVQAAVERCSSGACKPLHLCKFDHTYVSYGRTACGGCERDGSFCSICEDYKKAVDACSGGGAWTTDEAAWFGPAHDMAKMREHYGGPDTKSVYTGYTDSRTTTDCFEVVDHR